MKKIIYIITISVILFSQNGIAKQNIFEESFTKSKIKLEKNRLKYVEEHLTLTGKLAADFWPIYKDYREKITVLNERAFILLKIYSKDYNNNKISNNKAEVLMNEFMALDSQRLKVKAIYIDEFLHTLPAKVVWRFFHIENNLDTMINNAYINQIPLVNI